MINYTKESVVERALMSQHAPYAVVLDCVGGKELIPYMDHLVLDDPQAPHLGHYITIVGDSKSTEAPKPDADWQKPAEIQWVDHSPMFVLPPSTGSDLTLMCSSPIQSRMSDITEVDYTTTYQDGPLSVP